MSYYDSMQNQLRNITNQTERMGFFRLERTGFFRLLLICEFVGLVNGMNALGIPQQQQQNSAPKPAENIVSGKCQGNLGLPQRQQPNSETNPEEENKFLGSPRGSPPFPTSPSQEKHGFLANAFLTKTTSEAAVAPVVGFFFRYRS